LQENKVQVQGLDFYYGNIKALENITLDIKNESITAFIGPSGCGKSTLIRAINRMSDLIPEAKVVGKILLDGEDIYSKKIDVVALRKCVGTIFQRSNLFPKSIYENVAYGPKIHGLRDKKKLDEIVERSLIRAALWKEVKDKLNVSAFELSGGQQQRLCIARTLAVEPEILLMDEPCSALDPASTQRIEDLMQELKQKYTIIIVTHNMQQAARVSEHTAFFLSEKAEEAAHLIEFGLTDDIFTNPSDKRTENYITGRFG
jgi:phosphate transport system ATP-binding protein